MNSARLRAIEEGLNGIAKKVLAAVPVAEWWPSHQIISEMHRVLGTFPEKRIVDGCLAQLVEASIIRTQGSFPVKYQRVAVLDPPHRAVEPVSIAPVAAPADPLDQIAAYIGQVRGLLKQIEEASLALAQEVSDARKDGEKLRQLQALLKGIGT